MSTYNKPYLSFPDQINLLMKRGMKIKNKPEALAYLESFGYYRLSGYWYPLRKIKSSNQNNTKPEREDTFIQNAEFQHVIDLFTFDKKLRLILLDAIERIEIGIRVAIAYQLGTYDPFAHTNPTFLHGNFTKKIIKSTGETKHQTWLTNLEKQRKRSKEDFVNHYESKYGAPLPIWVAIELWDFGMLSVFYQGMRVHDKEKIAIKYGIIDWRIMESWLRCLNFIRNAVAHHNRLWNRVLTERPKLPKFGQINQFDPVLSDKKIHSKIYIILCIIVHFIKKIDTKSGIPEKLYTLLDNFPTVPGISIKNMGIPTDWKKHDFWIK